VIAVPSAMAEPLKTFIGGKEIELPSTIPGIRAALPEDRREAFDRSVNETSIFDLPTVRPGWLAGDSTHD
jgi:hypothetical protein